MKDTIIAIPSYKRADWLMESDNTALHNISKEYMDRTYLVVRDYEAPAYERVRAFWGCRIAVIPAAPGGWDGFGIRETRDAIFNLFLDKCDYLLVIEDDMRIDIKKDDSGHYKKMDDIETQFPKAMALLEQADMEVPVTSLLPRLFCISKVGKTKIMNGDCIQLTMFYAPFFREHKEYRYKDGPPMMEDFNFLIRLMIDGYGCLVFTDFVKQDVLNSKRTTDSGGCNAAGRTLKDLDRAAVWIANRYPEYVSAYSKVRPSTWGEEPTVGLKIYYSRMEKLYKGSPR